MSGVSEPFLCRKACSEQWLFACVLLEEFNTQHLQGTLGGSDSTPRERRVWTKAWPKIAVSHLIQDDSITEY